MSNQILVLQSLGIDATIVEELCNELNPGLQIVWSAELTQSDAVVALMTVSSIIDTDVLDSFSNLKVVSVAFTGYDCVDIDACKQRGVQVYNVPGYSTDSTAELTLGLMLSLLREIPEGDRTIRDGGWELESPGIELAGKTVGIIGTGAIGMRLAEICAVMKCKLTGWSRTRHDEFTRLGGKYCDELPELMSKADIVTVHLPLNNETRGIIGADELAAMKSTAFLVNTARGPIVDETALIDALTNRRIAGSALDVYEQEPLPDGHPLRTLDKVTLTPHIGYKTHEALHRRAQIALENVRSGLTGSDTNRVG